jgi:hypothetical protein
VLGLIVWCNPRKGIIGDNIKMDFPEVGWGMYWLDVAQNKDSSRAFVKAVMDLEVP